ncbi:hypothetical protein BDR07DRAFT_1371784 [Suillus spraguei]|nr:hypothetical protein BDR07DRAFT_1371784 [Suillus spraguei]
MPTSCAALMWCMCEECIRKGGYDKKGAPRGVLIAECSISAHLRHLSLTADHSQPPLLTSATRSTNLDHPGPSNILAVPVATLSDRLEWLKLSDSISAPPIKKADRETTSKLKHSRRTLKALQILANINSQIQRGFCLLLHPYNLDNIGHKLALLHTAIENVNGGADVVIAQKKAIIMQMDDLATQLASYQDVQQVPLKINTDALQQAPVDHSDEISQSCHGGQQAEL